MDELLFELRKAYGPNAQFREGQREAVEGILAGKRSLVVQKTGWGKSLVYFLATKVLRKRYQGLTIIISPLLALMNNQIESAIKFGIDVETINSENSEERNYVINKIKTNTVDALIISPERLANQEFKELLINNLSGRISLFVVDEAHCISDWGHDFRPDYRRIVDIVKKLPSNIPVLATTATANDRVVADIKQQLGENICISRGSLMRDSLVVQVIQLNTKEERLAWISENINLLPGTGLIYCLTVQDCQLVREWLRSKQVVCECYYADIERNEGIIKKDIVKCFMENRIKVLVATVAFGMGFDKPDIGFVIHFQKPANLVAYYQQIGRAGRNIDRALAILLAGNEDDEINHYFIESAFPTEELMSDIINVIQSSDGLRLYQIINHVNMKEAKIKACIKYLEVNGDIYSENGKYYKVPKRWMPDIERSQAVTKKRLKELDQMNNFVHTTECYMEFVAKVLDDPKAHKCGKCSNCLAKNIVSTTVKNEDIASAQQFIKCKFNIIEPRKKWPIGVKVDNLNKINPDFQCQVGWVLSNYGDAGWGRLVSVGKYKEHSFSDELVEASYQLLKKEVLDKRITWVTNISSLRRPQLVSEFARKLAKRLGLPYVDAIDKIKDVKCQKELNNSYMQFNNINDSFGVNSKVIQGENVLLVDDMVDSRWTFTVCGYKLLKNKCGKVYPFALANSAGRNGDD